MHFLAQQPKLKLWLKAQERVDSMADEMLTELEKRAEKGTKLGAFPVNLTLIRTTIRDLLKQVGKYGFFDEYTDHSFDHVHAMLETAEWVIPRSSKELLTDAEWIFLVLSIYFHDLGLLISRSEYDARESNAEYNKFKHEPPISPQKFSEFNARLSKLSPETAEKIMYQEFVRYTHGERIRCWIEGVPLDDNDASKEVRGIIKELLKSVNSSVKRDLALVCESHTKDDIGDTKKFKVSQPYGSSKSEEVNLQYIAAILRTVDLLQITNKRAPATLYQFINPSDPYSQVEWQKQGAVRSVRAQPAHDKDGQASDTIPPHTIEVHALFSNSDGFFGLTSYLSYAEKELSACHSAISKSSKGILRQLIYPWRNIDTSGVEADGFLTESFGFSLDQQKILDLLTGHTLYNDTSVVLRELTQNALDAFRLQTHILGKAPDNDFDIFIKWDSSDRTLTITDRGTGMSQETIVNHLLKVGSSRYQDPQFREKFPNFSSISRFGIGVLSAFMVSDDVQITTCNIEEPKARRISLRSVHGQYLIKLLDKVSDRDEIGVFPHGTSVRLVIRPTADIGNIVKTAKMWLMFPGCKVGIQIDNAEPVSIGYESPAEAVRGYISNPTFSRKRRSSYGSQFEVREYEENGVTLAFAVRRGSVFKDWDFVEIVQDRTSFDEEAEKPPIGICIEGVGVEFNTPGFHTPTILAVANAKGPTAPKTNVARSALEETPEQRAMISTIYRLYAKHISEEVTRLCSEEGYSLTRSTREAPFIGQPLMSDRNRLSKPALMKDAVAEIPMIMAESSKERIAISYKKLLDEGEFWTVESPLSRSIETFITEAPEDVTASKLIETLGNSASAYPNGMTVCNGISGMYMSGLRDADFEIVAADLSLSMRRITLRWVKRSNPSKWIRSSEINSKMYQLDKRVYSSLMEARERIRRNSVNISVNVPSDVVNFSGAMDSMGFVYSGNSYLNPNLDFSKIIFETFGDGNEDSIRRLVSYFLAFDLFYSFDFSISDYDALERWVDGSMLSLMDEYVKGNSKLLSAITGVKGRLFDPYAWDRNGSV